MNLTKSFSDKLVDNTCIFCGAPLTKDDKCNYCGSQYIYYNEFNNFINLPNFLEINTFEITVNYPNDFYNSAQEINIKCDISYYKILKDIIGFNLKNYDKIKKINILLDYRVKNSTEEYKLFLENSILRSLKKLSKGNQYTIEAEFIYDQFFILKD